MKENVFSSLSTAVMYYHDAVAFDGYLKTKFQY